jgi:hypothetical protein
VAGRRKQAPHLDSCSRVLSVPDRIRPLVDIERAQDAAPLWAELDGCETSNDRFRGDGLFAVGANRKGAAEVRRKSTD